MASEKNMKKIAELQLMEAQLQNVLMQKQSVQMEISEVENAIEELRNSDEEVYKIISGAMIKSTKEKLNKELDDKKKLLETKIGAMGKQEKILEKNSSDLRNEIIPKKQ